MTKTVSELSILETFVYIILCWLVISIWQRFIENYAYNELGLNRELAYHNFIVAMVFSGVFIVIITSAERIFSTDGNAITRQEVKNEYGLGFFANSKVNNDLGTNGRFSGIENYQRLAHVDLDEQGGYDQAYIRKAKENAERRKRRNSRKTNVDVPREGYRFRRRSRDL